MTPSHSVANQRTWRLRDPRETRAKSKKIRFRIWTIVLSILVLCMVAFLYVIWNHRLTYAGFLVTTHDFATVPHLPFQQDDRRALQQIIGDSLTNGEASTTLDEPTGLEMAATQFASWDAGKRDAAILYVSTHGITHRGTACLLESKFLSPARSQFDYGLYDTADLLQQLSRSKAGVKLLLLDAGRIAYDTRLGVLLNDFPSRLEQVVRNHGDNRLFVLLSHSTGQISGSDAQHRKSLFCQSVVAALRGAADQGDKPDREIMLHELYQYVWSDITRWKVSGVSLQTPVLLQGGVGRIGWEEAHNCAVVLATVPDKSMEEDAEETLPKKNTSGKKSGTAAMEELWPRSLAVAMVPALQTPKSTPPVKSATAASEGAEPADGPSLPPTQPPSQPPTAKSDALDANAPASGPVTLDVGQNPPAKPATTASGSTSTSEAAAETPLATMQELWQERDRLANPPAGRWSPIDFAPSHWRWLETLLLSYESRLRSGVVLEEVELPRLLHDLQTLAGEIESGVETSYQRPEVHQIAMDWRSFVNDPQRRVMELPELTTFTRAWQSCNRLFYDLPNFIRWQANTVLFERQVTCSSDLRKSSIDHLAELNSMLGDGTLKLEMEKSVQARLDELTTTHDQLRTVLQQACSQVNDVEGPVLDRLVDSLLATPLLNAGQRSLLVGKRATKPTARLQLAYPDMQSPPPPLDGMRSIVQWEVEYVRLCDPTAPSLVVPQTWNASIADTLGQDMLDYYEAIPEKLGASRSPALVWLVDSRGQPQKELAIVAPTLPLIAPPPAPVKLEFAKTLEPLRLQWRTPVEVMVTFHGEGLKDDRVTARVKYDRAQLIVRRSPEGDTLRGDDSFDLKYSSGEAAPHHLVLYVESTKLADSDRQSAAIEVQLRGVDAEGRPRKTEPQQLICQLPLPADVDVWIARNGESPLAPLLSQRNRLRPYPNRTTPFRLLLANRSQVPKTVKVELYAVPDPSNASSLPPNWAPGRIFVDGALRGEVERLVLAGDEGLSVRPDVPLLAEAMVELAADGETQVPILFQNPGSLSPPPATGAGDAAAAAKPAAAAPPPRANAAMDISQGLALVITNVQNPNDRIVKWLGILPAHPSEYLKVATVDCDGKRVRVQLQLDNPQAIPGVRDNPVRVLWDNLDTQRFINRALAAQLSDEVNRDRAELWADVPANTQNCLVELRVDGYPRALAYAIQCAKDEKGRSLADQRSAIRIVGLTPEYKDNKTAPGPKTPDGQPAEIPVVAGPDATNILAVRSDAANPCLYLHARFEVDVPANAFESRDPPASIQIDGRVLMCDRQVATTLDSLGEAGELVITSRVSDHRVPINVEGRTAVTIRAELRQRDEEPKSSQVAAILDGMAPAVTGIDKLPLKIETKQPLTMEVDFTDHSQSGVEQLVVAIDVDGTGTISDGDIQKQYSINRGSLQQDVELRTDDLEANSQGYRVLAQVTDRVGIPSEVRGSDTLVRVEAMKKVAPKELTKGTICGTLYSNNRPARVSSGTVTIKQLQRVTDVKDATFRFDDVPMGTYTLEARGDLSGFPMVSNPDAPTQATPKPPATAGFGDYPIHLVRPKPDQKK